MFVCGFLLFLSHVSGKFFLLWVITGSECEQVSDRSDSCIQNVLHKG